MNLRNSQAEIMAVCVGLGGSSVLQLFWGKKEVTAVVLPKGIRCVCIHSVDPVISCRNSSYNAWGMDS